MIKIYKNIGRTIVETEDIKTIPSGVLELLEMGDLVIKKTGDELHSYYVSYRKYNEMSLTYVDHQNSEEVYFEKGENGWEWITTDITPLSGGGGGSATTPIYDASLEEKDGKIVVNMAQEDRNDIYANKYPIIGIRIVDEEEETNVLYFKLRQDFITNEVLAYDLWDSDSEENTIAHLDLIFLWDGDEAKVQFDDDELQLGGGDGIYTANITIAQDYTKFYFLEDDLSYLKHNIPTTLKLVWDDGEGHVGAFVMFLSQTQGDQEGEMPRKYTTSYIESGTVVFATLEIDGGDTTVSGCDVEFGTLTASPMQ